MYETGHLGVDLALNSLSGELLHATWRCVARLPEDRFLFRLVHQCALLVTQGFSSLSNTYLGARRLRLHRPPGADAAVRVADGPADGPADVVRPLLADQCGVFLGGAHRCHQIEWRAGRRVVL